ncbi:MAG: hypothetical protein AB8E87_15025 [Prochlorococcus sp.]
MLWLIGLVLLLQAGSRLLIEPLIRISTSLLELRGIGFLLLVFAAWLIAGRTADRSVD